MARLKDRASLLGSGESSARDGSRWRPSPWLLEIGALLASALSLAAAVGIMASQNGKPVAEWKFPTSINTVVAVLGAISKATLAFTISACLGQHKWNWFKARDDKLGLFEKFDDARGPWGSLFLIAGIRGR